MYMKGLDRFEINYSNFDIDILKKTKLKGSINLPDTINLYNRNEPRYIRISAIDQDDISYYPFNRISAIIHTSKDEKNINYELDVISGKSYYIEYEFLVDGNFPSRYGLVAGPTYSHNISGYYSKNGFVKNKDEADIIPAYDKSIENINVNLSIPINIDIGRLQDTDVKTYLNEEEVVGFNINGNMAILVKDLKGRGFDVNLDLENKRIDIKNDLNASKDPYYDNDEKAGRIFYTDIKSFIDNKQINCYTLNQNTIIFVKDLKDFGFNVNFDDQKKN